MDMRAKAIELLRGFKGDTYAFGLDKLERAGGFAAACGRSALVIANPRYLQPAIERVLDSMRQQGVLLAGDRIVPDAGPNAPREDVYRLETYLHHFTPDCLIVIGGGSSIDAAKAANVLAATGRYNPEIDAYFGTGLVSEALKRTGRSLKPLIAVQTAASSGSHLTKYANVTDPTAGQKKLIVDEAIVPVRAVFDYAVTATMPVSLTIDGALDGIAHCLEVFYGIPETKFALAEEIATIGISLILQNARKAAENPNDLAAREALGLATDLGGYAIMVGGTNGAHLTSFSLVDIVSHGRACGIMNPYYTVFFAPAIERQLRVVGEILARAGFMDGDRVNLSGRQLGIAVAEGLVAFAESIGAPTRLSDLPGFTDAHIERALAAAKEPQLEMKLRNMPIPLTTAMIDEYMAPILQAAKTGDFSMIKNMA